MNTGKTLANAKPGGAVLLADALPPLPPEVDAVRCMIRGEKDLAEACDYYYTAEQMRDYAGAALSARQPVGQDWQHIANEWADAATNGVQWLRNIRDGASTVADALACMESNVERIQQLKPPAQAVDLGAVREAVRKAWQKCAAGESVDLQFGTLLALIDSQAVGK